MDREPGILRYVYGPWIDRDDHRAFIRERIEATYPPGLGYWCLALRETPEAFLGWVLLIPEDAKGPEVEIGWRLRTSAQGKGYAREAAARLLRYGLTELKLSRIVAAIHRDNQASQRLAEKIGLIQVGERVIHNLPAVDYAITAAGYPVVSMDFD
jgi:RimJ/RimL family protein N-acetyltransferase